MDRDEAFQSLAERERELCARIPADAPSWGRRHLKHVVDEQVAVARMHLTAIYDSGLAVGPGFSALEQHAAHPKYGFWVEGIGRHLEICAASLTGGPPGRAGAAAD